MKRILLLTALATSFSCKSDSASSSEKKPEEPTPPSEVTATPSTANVPWRVGFALDSASKDVYIPRPSSSEKGTAIVSFVARRAKDLSTWERIEVELASGTTEVVSQIDPTHRYEFHQHPEAGVDLAVFAEDGTRVTTLGPLRRVHLFTEVLAEEAPRVDGKASLVIIQGDSRTVVEPAALASIKASKNATTEQDAWDLLAILRAKATLGSAKTVVAFASGESRTFDLSELQSGKTQLLLRHNGRGELRLKVVSSASEDKLAGLRNLAKIELR